MSVHMITRQQTTGFGGGLTSEDKHLSRALLNKKVKAAMRSAAMEFESADLLGVGFLDVEHFGHMVRERMHDENMEQSIVDDWFNSIDRDGDGKLMLDEWFRFCVFDVESDLGSGVEFVLKDYDKDGNGQLSKREFHKALAEMGFAIIAHSLFLQFDHDDNGYVMYAEVIEKVRPDSIDLPAYVELSRALSRGDALDDADADDKFKEEEAHRLSAATNTAEVKASLEQMLKANAARVLDLFRDWDDDQSGLVTEKEFARAMGELGFEGGPDVIHAVYDGIDVDGDYLVSFTELNDWLNDGTEADTGVSWEELAKKHERDSIVDKKKDPSRSVSRPSSAVSRPQSGGASRPGVTVAADSSAEVEDTQDSRLSPQGRLKRQSTSSVSVVTTAGMPHKYHPHVNDMVWGLRKETDRETASSIRRFQQFPLHYKVRSKPTA